MSMKTTGWKYIKTNITDDDLNAYETLVGLHFSQALRDFLLAHNNGRPVLKGFDTAVSQGRVFDKLLSFNRSDTENVFTTYDSLRGELPAELVPLVADPFGNYLCLTRSQKDHLVFWEAETREAEAIGKNLIALVSELK
jgi:hypothetical protein